MKSSVLEGGVGCSRGGRLLRSRVRFCLLREEAEEEERDGRGEASIVMMCCCCVVAFLLE